MIFNHTSLRGPTVVELDKQEDARGFFARAFCSREFEQHDLRSEVVQVNLSYNHKAGTVRGLHYQVAPASEPKFVRCINGAIWDVMVDMRPASPTYLQYMGVELSAKNRKATYVPDMFAHGYMTLTDEAEVIYQVAACYTPGCERGVRHDDPAISIPWPLPVAVISDKDRCWPYLEFGQS